jgi:hypothetical protein
MEGRLVKELTSENLPEVSMDLGLREGIYILSVCNRNKNIIEKLMVN